MQNLKLTPNLLNISVIPLIIIPLNHHLNTNLILGSLISNIKINTCSKEFLPNKNHLSIDILLIPDSISFKDRLEKLIHNKNNNKDSFNWKIKN